MQLKTAARNFLCSLIILVQAIAFPSLAVAQEAAPEANNSSGTTSSSPTAAQPEKPKTTVPTPAVSKDKTYKDNGDGTWSNGEYTWNSTTKQTKPDKPQDYSYNPKTSQWDTKDWAYSSKTGRYEENKPAASSATPETAAKSTSDPNSSVKVDDDSTGTFDLFFDGRISNSFSSNATSGDALVQGNTQAGNALTGDAAAIATLINLLQSSWLGEDSQIATFINNIDGNVYGDLTIDPAKLAYNLPVGNSNSGVDVNIDTNGVIDNDIKLVATSGNATVDSNTTAGNATSGNATAMANVINMMNSAIQAGKSFLGMVNINGTFDGDILLPIGVLQSLIANNSSNRSSDLNVNSTANRTINNNVQTAAASGDAEVNSNTTAGDATSGNAQTAINTMNLVGQNLVGNNALLVFVNVLGEWVGMVVGPSGISSMNTVDAGGNQSVSVSATENSLINNRISVAAQSGTARVTNNTTAGDATSGNASATVNLLNMIGSNVQMTDWFGILFINVFGNWFGSFGADTANGGFSQSPQPSAPANPGTGGIGGGSGVVTASTTPTSSGGGTYYSSANRQVFGFIPGAGSGSSAAGQGGDAAVIATTVPLNTPEQFVFGAKPGAVKSSSDQVASGAAASSDINWWLMFGVVGMIATLVVLAREYVLAIREEQRLA